MIVVVTTIMKKIPTEWSHLYKCSVAALPSLQTCNQGSTCLENSHSPANQPKAPALWNTCVTWVMEKYISLCLCSQELQHHIQCVNVKIKQVCMGYNQNNTLMLLGHCIPSQGDKTLQDPSQWGATSFAHDQSSHCEASHPCALFLENGSNQVPVTKQHIDFDWKME